MFRLMTAVVLLALVAGCPDRAAQPPAAKKPAPVPQAAAATTPPKAAFPCPPAAAVVAQTAITVDGSPGNEEHSTFQLAGKSAAKVPLHEAPGDNSASAGELSVGKGRAIKTSASRMLISTPQPLVVPSPQKLHVSAAKPQGGELVDEAAEPFTVTLKKGETVGYVHYAGEGSHYLVVHGCLLLGSAEHDPNSPWPELKAQAVAGQQWWVKVEGSPSGWMRIDPKVIAVKRSTAP